MDEIGKLDGILDEEHGDRIPYEIKYAFVCVAVIPVSAYPVTWCSRGSYNRVANPCTSLTVSALPLDPATVEKRTNVGVFFPFSPRNEAAVMLL